MTETTSPSSQSSWSQLSFPPPPSPPPPVTVRPGFQLFVVRHGERVDQAFGNDWLKQAFRLHHEQRGDRPQRHKRQSIVTDGEGGYSIVQPPPSPPRASSPPSSSPPSPSSFTDEYASYQSGLRLPHSLHHATYHRFNLNMPLPLPTHVPHRDIRHYADDSPLTQCGHWQAATVGSAFNGMGIGVVYCSPALRCLQTAQELVQAMAMRERRGGWSGIRVEPALFEWMGWYSKHPAFLSPHALRANGFDVDESYCPLSSLPPVVETQQGWYQRSAQLVRRLLSSPSAPHHGNVLIVAHAASHDVLSYGLLHSVESPSEEELEMGSRHRLYSNYCGVSRLRYDGSRQAWLVGDDSRFDLHNTSNEPFSFQLSYVSVERQRRQREAQQGAASSPLLTPIDSYVAPAAASADADAEALTDLDFARSFGFLLDCVHSLSSQLQSLPSLSSLSDAELSQLIRSIAEPIAASVTPVLPEWARLAAACDGALQSHVIRCFVCVDLLLRPTADWAALSRRDKNVLSWAVLLHDIAKIMKREDGSLTIKRDPIHPFNSAVVAARIFAREGFSHGGREAAWSQQVEDWAQLVQSAIVEDSTAQAQEAAGCYSTSLYALRHDNSLLPLILQQLLHLFGTNTLMADTVKLVLLHQSIPFIAAFPPASPLSDSEALQLVDRRLLRLLEMLHIVDSASYQINRPQQQLEFVQEIRLKAAQLDALMQDRERQQAASDAAEAAKDREEKEDSQPQRRHSDSSSVAVFSPDDAEAGSSSSRGSLSLSVNERTALMSGLSSSSSFSVSADDLSSSAGADAVVLTADNAAEYGLSPRYATLKEETEADVEMEMDERKD